MASGKVIVAAGQGSIPLRVHDHRGNPVEILLNDVLFLPDGNHNLLSYPVLRQHGHRYRERDDDAEIRLSTGIRLPLDRRFDGIDYLRCVSNNMENIATTATAMMIHNDPGIERIHMRMGHLNLQALKDLGLIDVVDPEFFCHTCALSKSARHSISKKADARQLPPGKLIHTDFAGPFEVPTSGGMKYAIVFIDDRTRYNFVYLMKSPKECLLKFRLVIHDFAELNVAIGQGSVLQADNHSNYRNTAFSTFCKDRGIIQRYSPPHSQAKNGIAERFWRTAVESARAMITNAHLTKPFWGVAVIHAAFLKNISPHAALPQATDTPYYLLRNDHFQHYDKLLTFGSAAYVHLEKGHRKKLDPKARAGVYIGFAERTACHRVFIPAQSSTVESMHVTFTENFIDNEPTNPAHGPADTDNDSATVDDGEESADIAMIQYSFSSPTDNVHDVLVLAASQLNPDPNSIQEAMDSDASDHWMVAVQEELTAHEINGTWTVLQRTEIPSGAKPLRCRFVFKTKRDEHGDIQRYKARLCARGFTQRPGIDYSEVFSPVAQRESIRIFLSVCAANAMPVHLLDVTTAFLNPPVEELLFMEPPPTLQLGPDKVLKLNKSLYGLKQASRCWSDCLADWFEQDGFKRSLSDPCIFTKRNGTHDTIMAAVWVDDIIFAASGSSLIEEFVSSISSTFKLKYYGRISHCLGMRIRQSPSNSCISIDQDQPVLDILERFGMAESRSVKTPLAAGTALQKYDTVATPSETLLGVEEASLFREITGSLLYLVCCTRIDLAVAVNQLSQVMAAPTITHMTAAKHILRYLNCHRSIPIVYRRQRETKSNVLEAYVDATWATVPHNKRSITGYAILLNGAVVSWKTAVQRCVCLSSTEAEYLALSTVTREIMYLRQLLEELGSPQTAATLVHEDNKPAIFIATNPATTAKSKYIALRYHFVRDAVKDKVIRLQYTESKQQRADLLTKIIEHGHAKYLLDLLVGSVDEGEC